MRGSSGMPGRRTALEPGGDDAAVERDGRGALEALDAQDVRRGELREAADDLDLALLGQPLEALRQARDDRLLPAAQPVDVDLRLAERDALALALLGLGDHARDVEQRLRRDAADVEADPAEPLVALDEDDLQAEVGGAERGRVPARPGAEHDDVGVVVRGALDRRRRHRGQRRGPRPSRPRAGRRSPAAPAASSVRIRVPSETVSPTDSFSSRIVPAAGDGTSIVALSDSSVTSGSSSATVSPGLTITSMTGTSAKSPMSGTLTSIVDVAAGGGRRVAGGRLDLLLRLLAATVAGAVGRGAVEDQEDRPLGDGVADRDLELADRPGRRRRDVHRRLVGLERDERVLLGHRVAGAHHDLDDRDVGEVADVRDLDLERISHGAVLL